MAWAERWVRAIETPRLLVVGGASLDRIHVAGTPVATAGGAGLYTALAAARAGVEVTMLAPYPEPMPPELAPLLDVVRWVGPKVEIDGLPRFEIAYDSGGAVTLFIEHLGAEPDMTPDLLDLVDDLPPCAYCVPFMDARLQRRFVDALRDRGCLTVAATYGKAARSDTELVRDTFAIADLSFCNADEEAVLFGGSAAPKAGRFRFVTRGATGVSVFQGDHRTDLAATPTTVVDPTGAGDTFCGTAVARLLLGDHPVEAARRANAAAGAMVAEVGPRALFGRGSAPDPEPDRRARVDPAAVDSLATTIAAMSELRAFDFTGDLFPPVDDPGAAAWFAAATLQQFGFWYERDGGWAGSMIATIDGARRKGSDYLWAAYLRRHGLDPAWVTSESQGQLSLDDWHAVAADDGGVDPFPEPLACVELANAYGRSVVDIGTDIAEVVTAASRAERPMRALLTLLDHVGGYREDPLRKKAALLGVILRQRPERFLPEVPGDDAPPIVDYHVQRSCLRTGLVVIDDDDLELAIRDRRSLPAASEEAIRRATSEAVGSLARRSGRSMGAVDWFLFQMRNRCPESTEPICSACPADPVCGHRTELFQPVRRTTFY